jgi:hypothetical protein
MLPHMVKQKNRNGKVEVLFHRANVKYYRKRIADFARIKYCKAKMTKK